MAEDIGPIVFRALEGTDLERVSELERRANDFPWSRQKIADSLAVGCECWLACLSRGEGEPDDVAAYTLLSCVLDEASLLNFCVDPSHQGRGIGRALLGFLLGRAEREGLSKIFLEVRASNQRAIALYESAGFRQLACRKAYYPIGDGVREDALVYCREFRSSSS